MRGAPHVGFSATMRKMSSRSSMLTHFLPAGRRCRESHSQYNLNPALCQRTTVSGWTKINGCFHPGQRRRNSTQNNLSEPATCGRGYFRFKAMSCCLRARFSKNRSRREQENRVTRTSRSVNRWSIQPGLHPSTGQTRHTMHLPDLAADRILARYKYRRSRAMLLFSWQTVRGQFVSFLKQLGHCSLAYPTICTMRRRDCMVHITISPSL